LWQVTILLDKVSGGYYIDPVKRGGNKMNKRGHPKQSKGFFIDNSAVGLVFWVALAPWMASKPIAFLLFP